MKMERNTMKDRNRNRNLQKLLGETASRGLRAGLWAALGVTLTFTSPRVTRAEETAPDRQETASPRQSVMYGIGSTSKVFVTAAVMKLADEGLVDMDASLTTYIPEFEMNDDRYRDITPRMLLDHTSGIPGSTLTNAMLLGDSDTYNHDHLLESLKSQRLKADPGAFGVYCNDGFTLAEILVERVTGMSFTDYLGNAISTPLGLQYFKTPQSRIPEGGLASTYDGGTGWQLPPSLANVIGSGGIFSTAEDLCLASRIFMRDDNGQILSDNALNEMEYSSYSDQLQIGGTDTTLEYGLGWDSVNTYPFNRYGIRAFSKGGDTITYHASLTVLPDEGISCAVLSSGGSSLPNQIAVQEILLTYLEEIGRIEREEALEKEMIARNDIVSPASMPSELIAWSGWYDGSQLLEVQVREDGTLTLSGSDDDYSKSQTYLYQDDGKFYSTAGSYISADGKLTRTGGGKIGRSTLQFTTTADGRRYLMSGIQEAYPGLGITASYLPIAEKMSQIQQNHTVDKATEAAWQKRSGREYYLVSEKYSSIAYLDKFMITPKIPSLPDGYLIFKDGYPSMARLTDPLHAEFFQQIPGQAGRDLSDYAIVEEHGQEYLVSNSHRFLSAEAVTPLSAADTTITIPAAGEAIWFTTDETHRNRPLVIETPEHGSYFIYDHSGRDMTCVGGSCLGAPGQQHILPKDGRIVFAGDAGEEFRLIYVD